MVNPALILIVFVLIVVVYFCSSSMYRTIGKIVNSIINDAVDAIEEVSDDEDE